jgi:hypothetical protein
MTRTKAFSLTLALAALAPSTTMAAAKAPTPDAAIRKGVRDFVRLEAKGGKASAVAIKCRPVTKVGQQAPCTGSFKVTLKSRTATYVLTKKARTLRVSPGAIEYRLSAKAVKKVAGLPGATDLSGFLQ